MGIDEPRNPFIEDIDMIYLCPNCFMYLVDLIDRDLPERCSECGQLIKWEWG